MHTICSLQNTLTDKNLYKHNGIALLLEIFEQEMADAKLNEALILMIFCEYFHLSNYKYIKKRYYKNIT